VRILVMFYMHDQLAETRVTRSVHEKKFRFFLCFDADSL